MAFQRDGMLQYAKRYWNRPCNDGYFMLNDGAVDIEQKRLELKAPASEGWEAVFLAEFNSGGGLKGEYAAFQKPNGDEIPIHGWRGLADCAHYISKCLEPGGIKVHEMSVPKLVTTLRQRGDTKTLGKRLSREAAQRILDLGTFKKGDVIAYFNVDPHGDYEGKQDYTHSTMYLGKDGSGIGRIACHTICRHGHLPHNDQWWLKNGSYTYTLIHFAADDPLATEAGHLEGWWRIEYFGRKEYYRLFKDGTLRWTYQAPKTPTDQIEVNAKRKGYWFQYPQELRVCWQSTGTVERWKFARKANSYDITVNDHHGKAYKMFT